MHPVCQSQRARQAQNRIQAFVASIRDGAAVAGQAATLGELTQHPRAQLSPRGNVRAGPDQEVAGADVDASPVDGSFGGGQRGRDGQVRGAARRAAQGGDAVVPNPCIGIARIDTDRLEQAQLGFGKTTTRDAEQKEIHPACASERRMQVVPTEDHVAADEGPAHA